MPLPSSRWVVRRRPRDDAPLRLFLVPHAGAGAVIYHEWPSSFPDSIDVCAIDPPGRFARCNEAQHRDVCTFAREMAAALLPYVDRPFAFFGYSLGALMAFECARELRRQGQHEPARFVVAAHKAPQLPARHTPIGREPTEVLVRELERRYGPIDPIIKKEPEMFRLVIEMMRVDLGMLEGYRYYHESAFDCPILAIGGTEDPTLTECELEAWSAQTTGRFSVRRLPGSHFFLRTAGPELRELVVRALEW